MVSDGSASKASLVLEEPGLQHLHQQGTSRGHRAAQFCVAGGRRGAPETEAQLEVSVKRPTQDFAVGLLHRQFALPAEATRTDPRALQFLALPPAGHIQLEASVWLEHCLAGWVSYRLAEQGQTRSSRLLLRMPMEPVHVPLAFGLLSFLSCFPTFDRPKHRRLPVPRATRLDLRWTRQCQLVSSQLLLRLRRSEMAVHYLESRAGWTDVF